MLLTRIAQFKRGLNRLELRSEDALEFAMWIANIRAVVIDPMPAPQQQYLGDKLKISRNRLRQVNFLQGLQRNPGYVLFVTPKPLKRPGEIVAPSKFGVGARAFLDRSIDDRDAKGAFDCLPAARLDLKRDRCLLTRPIPRLANIS